MSHKKFFTGGSHLSMGMHALAMGAQMLESKGTVEQEQPKPGAEPPEPQKPAPTDQILENKKPVMTLEIAHQMIVEAATTNARQNALSGIAEAVMQWAAGSNPSFDDLDGYAMALAGIGDDDADPTDEQDDAYNAVWSNICDFLVAAGLDDDTISELVDDEDDDAAATVASDLNSLTDSDADELIATFSVSQDDAMLEAVQEVVRHGKAMRIKKRIRPRRLTSLQKQALKKARMKAHTASANLSRKKSMTLRRKRFGR